MTSKSWFGSVEAKRKPTKRVADTANFLHGTRSFHNIKRNRELHLRRISKNRGGTTLRCPVEGKNWCPSLGFLITCRRGFTNLCVSSQRKCLWEILFLHLCTGSLTCSRKLTKLCWPTPECISQKRILLELAQKVLLANGDSQSPAKSCLNGCRGSLVGRWEKGSVICGIYTALFLTTGFWWSYCCFESQHNSCIKFIMCNHTVMSWLLP